MTIGMGSIFALGLKIVANREKIASVWSELVPAIKTAREQFPKIRDLIDDIAPGIVDATEPEDEEPMSVSWLQESLNTLQGAELEVDGDYGEMTKEAVREYQEEHPPLVVDGWAGIATQSSIYEELANRK